MNALKVNVYTMKLEWKEIHQNEKFAVSVWNPFIRKYIDKLESVQHRSIRLVPCLRKKPY